MHSMQYLDSFLLRLLYASFYSISAADDVQVFLALRFYSSAMTLLSLDNYLLKMEKEKDSVKRNKT